MCVRVHVCVRTWVNDLVVVVAEGDMGAPPPPLGAGYIPVALLDAQRGDALVVGRVELCQILFPGEPAA